MNETRSALSERTSRLGKAPLGKLIISLSVPGMMAMITMTLYHLVDTFWVAKLGHEAIASLAVIMPVQGILLAVSLGSGIGISSLTSRHFGEGNIESTNHIAGHVFPISAIFGGLSIALYLIFTQPLLSLGGATPDIMDYATQYLSVIAFGSPFMVFSMISNELLRASGDALRPMIFSITGAVINIALDPLFIFGLGPFPEMGVGGAALATVISQFIGALLAFLYVVVMRRSAFKITIRHLKPSLSILRNVYSVGFPTMLTVISESITFIILNQVLSGFGSIALAAGGLAMRIIDFAYMPVFGASEGVLPIIGYSYGAKLINRLWRTVRLSSFGLSVILGIFTIFAVIFTPQLIGLFTDEVELINQSIMAVRIFLSTVFIFGPSNMFITTFMGLGKGKDVFFLSMARQVALVAALLILPRVLDLNGAWMSMPVADVVGFVFGGIWIYREYKNQQNQIDLVRRNSEAVSSG
ncbi:MAG: MATE family efflux transporter [Dehalococcoidales bacterium]|nr:MATE family efflux transporter [Dehalococcoidales bacterium]